VKASGDLTGHMLHVVQQQSTSTPAVKLTYFVFNKNLTIASSTPTGVFHYIKKNLLLFYEF
jgi:hypothetical protein